MADLRIGGAGGTFDVVVRVPGDKSLSHRALLFAAMASGDSIVIGAGNGADIRSTAASVSALGVDIDRRDDEYRVRSPGVPGWVAPDTAIDCGNSGTTMRLLAGILSTSGVHARLTGDESLVRRPMARLIDPLRALNGRIDTADGGTAPLDVGGADETHGASVAIPIASAQVRTAFELAALGVDGPSDIDSPGGFRDHTERWLHAIGRGTWLSDTKFRIEPGAIPPARYEVPGDPSSAAFLWACAAIHPGSAVTTPSVSLNPGRLGFLEILERMGATITAEVTGATGGDPVGDVRVAAGDLRGVDVGGDLAVAALDELPLVAVLGAFAEGITTVRDAEELRTKESDRVGAITALIRTLGGGAEERPDGFDVVGTGFLESGTVETHHDHRVAMAAAVAATRIPEGIVVRDAEIASVSWPTFYATLEGLWS
jgi:3-phosphoshikimate 1-carboxyvinyltransferase